MIVNDNSPICISGTTTSGKKIKCYGISISNSIFREVKTDEPYIETLVNNKLILMTPYENMKQLEVEC
tara:strand:- start:704 stop:907 length:204 start_codon:yes stop_codon:yes gene_type:complete